MPVLVFGALAALCGTPRGAAAETLAEAIALAFQSNPELQSQRIQQQVVDEGYVQAKAGWRPTVTAQASGGFSRAPQSDPFFGTVVVNSNTASVGVTLSQPLYSGGRTLNAVRAAKYDILAGRQQLRSTEAQVLAAVIGAYVQVILDTKSVEIRQRDVSTFEAELAETQARFKVGDLTRTDVAQTQTQLESARQALNQTRAELQSDRVSYTSLVGQPPGSLEDPPPLAGLPQTIDQAFDTAEEANPDLAKAIQAEAGSRARLAEARAAWRPSITLQGSIGYVGGLNPFNPNGFVAESGVQAVINQPIYSGGLISSSVRQAVDQNNIDRIAIETTRRAVVQAVTQSWNAWMTAAADIKSAEAGDAAAREAARGSLIEYRNGLRTTTDVLIAQEALSTADLAVAQALRDRTLAEAALLGAEGQLEAKMLIAGAGAYDPARSLKKQEHASDLPTQAVFEALDHLPPSSGSNRAPTPAPSAASPTPTLKSPSPEPAAGSTIITIWPAPKP